MKEDVKNRWQIGTTMFAAAAAYGFRGVKDGDALYWWSSLVLAMIGWVCFSDTRKENCTTSDMVGFYIVEVFLLALPGLIEPLSLLFAALIHVLSFLLMRASWDRVKELLHPATRDIRYCGQAIHDRIGFVAILLIHGVLAFCCGMTTAGIVLTVLGGLLAFRLGCLMAWRITEQNGTFTLHRLTGSLTFDRTQICRARKYLGRVRVTLKDGRHFRYPAYFLENDTKLFFTVRDFLQER